MTQKELGDKLGISHKTVSAYENNRATIKSTEFPHWAAALGVSVPEFTAALGFGVSEVSGDLARALAPLYGPDQGAEYAAALQAAAKLPETERQQLLNTVLDAVDGHIRRLGRPGRA